MKKNRLVIALACLSLVLTGCKGNTWNKEGSHTVTFNANGGEFADGSKTQEVTVNHGEKVSKPRDPEKQYFELDYWYIDGDNSKGFNFETSITSDLSLKAEWKQDPCTLFACTHRDSTFDGSFLVLNLVGRNNDNFNLLRYLVMSEGATVVAIDPQSQSTYDVDSLYIHGYETNYVLKVTSRDRVNSRNYYLTVYQDYAVHLTYMFKGNSLFGVDVPVGRPYNLNTYTPSAEQILGYIFLGWTITEGSEDIITVLTPNEDAVVYAVVKADSYMLTFDPNGGTVRGSSEEFTAYVTYGDDYEFPVPEKEGYDFLYWAFRHSGTQLTDKNGRSLSPWSYTGSFEVVSACYEQKYFTMEFVVNGQTVHTDSASYGTNYHPGEMYVPPLDPELELEYWTLNGVRCDSITVTGPLTFVAKISPRTVNVHLPDGSIEVVNYGESFVLPTPYVSAGYEFYGYYYQSQQITDEYGYSFDNWTYTTLKDVYVEADIRQYYYHIVYYINNQYYTQEDLLAIDCTEETPLLDYTAPSGQYFYGWYQRYEAVSSGQDRAYTLREARWVEDSSHYMYLYSAVSEYPNLMFDYPYDIQGSAFSGVSDEFTGTSITLPETFNGRQVSAIGVPGRDLFLSPFPSAIQSITLPSSVELFHNVSFLGLTNLTYFDVYGDDGELAVTSDHKVLYTEDFKGDKVVVAATKDIESYVCDNRVYEILPNAFQGCYELRTIELYGTLMESIGVGAFSGCYDVNILFHGTQQSFDRLFNSNNLPNSYSVTYLD